DVNGSERNARTDFKFQTEMQGSGQVKPASCANFGKRNHAHGIRYDITNNHAEQNRTQFQNAFAEMAERGNNQQRDDSNQPVLGRTKALCARTTSHIFDSGGIERQADGKNNSTCYEWREQHTNLFDEDAEQNGNDTADDFSAQNGWKVELSA